MHWRLYSWVNGGIEQRMEIQTPMLSSARGDADVDPAAQINGHVLRVGTHAGGVAHLGVGVEAGSHADVDADRFNEYNELCMTTSQYVWPNAWISKWMQQLDVRDCGFGRRC